jgi:DNA invertase Pin-like site-specific DNA recombinase
VVLTTSRSNPSLNPLLTEYRLYLVCYDNWKFCDTGGTMLRPAIAYLRVSTAEQVEGFGLAVQERAIREYCKPHGLRLVALYRDEGQSGSNGLDDRTGLAEALIELEARHASALVVYRLDRLARDLLLQETLIAKLQRVGSEIISVTEPDIRGGDPTRDLVRQVLGAISQYERAVIRGRMVAGKAAKVRAGGYGGGRPPYGMRAANRELEPDPEEAAMVTLARQLHKKGNSLREIGQALTEAGYEPRSGTSWHPNTVRRMLSESL